MSTLTLPNQRPRPRELDPEDRVFRHKTRPDWGMGVWVREESSRRRLRFEDGEMRAFKEGYYGFLVPVDSDKVDVDEVFERVMGEHEEATTLGGADLEPPVMPFAQQLDVFLHLYPGGFAGEAYQAAWGSEASAARQLTATSKALRSRLAEVAHPALAADVALETLDATALVSPTTFRSVSGLEGEQRERFGAAVLQLIHGETRFSRRFATWLRDLDALGIAPKWRLATALLGLYYPKKHMVVRRQVLQLQSRAVVPGKIPSKPSLAGYRRARRTARGVRDKLLAAGMKPAHLLDVHAFVWDTLRPKGQRLAKDLAGG